MSKLDDILELYHNSFYDSHALKDMDSNEAKQEIKQLFLDIVGQDEEYRPSPSGAMIDIHYRNQLKAELRKKVEEL